MSNEKLKGAKLKAVLLKQWEEESRKRSLSPVEDQEESGSEVSEEEQPLPNKSKKVSDLLRNRASAPKKGRPKNPLNLEVNNEDMKPRRKNSWNAYIKKRYASAPPGSKFSDLMKVYREDYKKLSAEEKKAL